MENADVPPLEDMSDAFTSCLKLREERSSKLSYKRNEVLEIPDNAEKLQTQKIEKLLGKNDASEQKDVTKRKEKKTEETFCGFKKGFLVATNQSSKKKNETKKDVPVVTKKTDVKKNVLPEVQNAMKQMPILQSNDWVTEDLLSKISANPRLFQRFMDPRFADVIQKFQSNPQEVMQLCENNPEMKEFIQDFCSVMGDHFTKLGEKQEQKAGLNFNEKPEEHDDEKKMKKILANPEIAAILQMSEVQRLLKFLKEDPIKAQRLLQSADSAFRAKIQKLVDAGLLQMAV